MVNTDGIEERDEENNGYVVDNKAVSHIDLRNDLLTSDKRKINDVVINLTKGDISIEKGVSRNNNTSTKDNVGTSKQIRNSSFYLKNRNNNPIIRKDASATTNNTNIVYNAKNSVVLTFTTNQYY